MIKVGYISELNITDSMTSLDNHIYRLVEQAKEKELKVLVVCGGISNNYQTTISFVEEIGKRLSREGITFRFLCGNTDFYYREGTADKEGKFREILSKYRNNQYYLPKRPLIFSDTWLLGSETWYDYSLYRGKPVKLSKITKKSYWGRSNPDSVYITSPEDYVFGLNNLFDTRYTKECKEEMDRLVYQYLKRIKRPQRLVIAEYFYPSQIFLQEGFYEKYFGTFKGSSEFIKVMEKYGITDCIVGLDTQRKSFSFEGIRYNCSSGNKILEVEYP